LRPLFFLLLGKIFGKAAFAAANSAAAKKRFVLLERGSRQNVIETGGEGVSQQIKCEVEECIYNNAMNCHASNINVRSSGTRKVRNPDETACETFRLS